jgi:hypothetical protein
MQEVIGQGCFHQWCEHYGGSFKSADALFKSWSKHIKRVKNEVSSIISDLVDRGFYVIHYESSWTKDDGNRSREFVGMFIHRDIYSEFERFCKDDQSFEYIFTDAETEVEIRKKEGGKFGQNFSRELRGEPVHIVRHPDNSYQFYAYKYYPIGPMFSLREGVANHIINNYIYAMVYSRDSNPSIRILIFLKCFLDRHVEKSRIYNIKTLCE